MNIVMHGMRPRIESAAVVGAILLATAVAWYMLVYVMR